MAWSSRRRAAAVLLPLLMMIRMNYFEVNMYGEPVLPGTRYSV